MKRTKAELAALERDDMRCRRCGRGLEGTWQLWSVHHRLPRSAASKAAVDVVANLVLVCGSGTSPDCHWWIHQHPTESYDTGWLIRRGGTAPPDMVPLVDLAGRELFLTDQGGVAYAATKEAYQ